MRGEQRKCHSRVTVASMALVQACLLQVAWAGEGVQLRTISSRPDMVSGGDVLVELRAEENSSWRARLNGADVTQSFRSTENARSSRALLGGLLPGRNTIEIRVKGARRSQVTILDHSLSGPILSGPHQEPFVCQTQSNGLPSALDSGCSAKTIVQYYYKSIGTLAVGETGTGASGLAPGFKPYDPAGLPPSDVAQITISGGRIVPYIVRREVGVINRAVYDIQFLHQPDQALPTPWTRPNPGWNGRLVYLFDFGCGAGYRQGTFPGSVGLAQEPFLARGYATATSTLNVFGNSCNDRIAAETLSMVKEHFIKEFGEPVHTIGWGSSGGAMEQNLTAQNYPGLLDGIIPGAAFPDLVTWAPSVTDCVLLEHAFQSSKQRWTEEQKTAVSGFATWRACHLLSRVEMVDPQRFCAPVVPQSEIYDPTTNPRGARCDIYDNEINVFGTDPKSGFARRPLDNVGVQYGLVALNSAQIDAEQFVDLNERIGGLDDDGQIVAKRTEADSETIRIAYERGLVLTGGGGLSEIPIIEWRNYGDDIADGHDRFRSIAARARLQAASGSAANHVILVYPRFGPAEYESCFRMQRCDAAFPSGVFDLVSQMDRWLDNIAADNTEGSLKSKVARNKPSEIADACWATEGKKIVEPATYDGWSTCNQLYPSHSDPHIAAGGPLADDILKCDLKPISPTGYVPSLTRDQLQRLERVFPRGVCDYSRPGIGQKVTTAVWQTF